MSKVELRRGSDYVMRAEAPCRTPNEKRKHLLPYGIWVCRDGREVLFNRFYKPLWERRPGEPVAEADRSEWVEGIEQQRWFYKDGTPDKARVARRALREWMSR